MTNAKTILYNLIFAAGIFFIFYLAAAFTAWDIDCRNWEPLGRYIVVLITLGATACMMLTRKKPK